MKTKKHMISFITLLVLLLCTVILFIILVKNANKDGQEAATETNLQVTETPTATVAPTTAPTPTIPPVEVTQLYPASQKDGDTIKYGYIDKSGAFVIQPSFDYASDFYDGAAVVTMNSKYCVIDEKGTVLFMNDSTIDDFCNGVASYLDGAETDNPLYGYIDTKGNILIEPKYSFATDFSEEGTAYVKTPDNQYALIDKTGKVLESYSVEDKYSSSWSLQDGYLIYSASDYANYGVVNVKGEDILPAGYSEINYLGNDLFAVKKPGLDQYDEIMTAKQAIVNAKGEQLSDYSYYDVSVYTNGYCSADDDTSTFFIGTDGQKAANLPEFEGSGTVKLFGDVVSAYIDEEQLYCTTDKAIFWQTDTKTVLSDSITIDSLKYKPFRGVVVYYPQVQMPDKTVQDLINNQLYGIFVTSRADLKKEDLLTVDDRFSSKLMKNLLIIEKDGYDYYYGAAHGMPIMDFTYFDTVTGAAYQLKDLFLEGSDYMSKISAMITEEITRASESEDSMYFPDTFKGIAENQYFMLDEDSITIYFYPYDIAAYAAGFPQFTIPFDDISELINKDGTFWKSFQDE